jgi:hypothetical protein
MTFVLYVLALTVVNDATNTLNAWGDTLVACLQDVPIRAREVALHDVRTEPLSP